MIADYFTRSVNIVHSGEGTEVDAYGNEIRIDTTTQTVGALQQRVRNEEEGTVGTEDWLLLIPAGVAIDLNDRVQVDTEQYEVIGPPTYVFNPRTRRNHHVEATLRRTGATEHFFPSEDDPQGDIQIDPDPGMMGPQGRPGPPGPAGDVELYEQPDEPETAHLGAIWVDTGD